MYVNEQIGQYLDFWASSFYMAMANIDHMYRAMAEWKASCNYLGPEKPIAVFTWWRGTGQGSPVLRHSDVKAIYEWCDTYLDVRGIGAPDMVVQWTDRHDVRYDPTRNGLKVVVEYPKDDISLQESIRLERDEVTAQNSPDVVWAHEIKKYL